MLSDSHIGHAQVHSNSSSRYSAFESVRKNLASLAIGMLGFLGALLLRAIEFTLTWEVFGVDGDARNWPQGEPCISVFWHDQQLFMPWLYLKFRQGKAARSMVALISAHRDGRIVARIVKALGIDSIAGSTTRRGREAMFSLIRALEEGNHVAITPDGPRGPRHRLKSGVIRIAQRAGAPIYPIAIACERAWTFRSWDRMFLPKPFSRAVLLRGERMEVPKTMEPGELEAYAQELEKRLSILSEEAARRILRIAAS